MLVCTAQRGVSKDRASPLQSTIAKQLKRDLHILWSADLASEGLTACARETRVHYAFSYTRRRRPDISKYVVWPHDVPIMDL